MQSPGGASGPPNTYRYEELAKNLKKRIVSGWVWVIATSMVCYIALRVFSIRLKSNLEPDSIWYLSIEPVGNVMDNLFSGICLAAIAYALSDVIRDWLYSIRTVKTVHFDGLHDCMKILAEAIGVYKDKIESAHVTAVAPLIWSQEYVNYYYQHDSRVRDKKHAKRDTLAYLDS